MDPAWRRLQLGEDVTTSSPDDQESLLVGSDGAAAFDAALASNTLTIVQPDLAKWGGLSGCSAVANSIAAAGARESLAGAT